jgi:hypothetical protein
MSWEEPTGADLQIDTVSDWPANASLLEALFD